MERSPRWIAPLIGALLMTVSCGDSARTASEAPAPTMRLLAPSAVPRIPSKTSALPATELAKDASIPGLASKLATWGYRGGRQRTFQGESRHLTLVVSRSLVFENVTGAQAFTSFVHENAASYFGIGTEVHPLDAHGRSGWEFVPPACACHMANPEEVAVTAEGSTVTWLEINGPAATRKALVRLLDPDLEVAAP